MLKRMHCYVSMATHYTVDSDIRTSRFEIKKILHYSVSMTSTFRSTILGTHSNEMVADP
jgi:hypothetical protein